MTNTSGGGGSNTNKRANPQVRKGTPLGSAGTTRPKMTTNYTATGAQSTHTSKAEIERAQRDNRRRYGEDVYDPEGKRRRIDAQVKKADAAAAANRKKPTPAKKAAPAKRAPAKRAAPRKAK